MSSKKKHKPKRSSSAKHPGSGNAGLPWQTSGELYTDVIEIWTSNPDGTMGFLIADVHRDTGKSVNDSPDEAEKYAGLIVAAPELLEALHDTQELLSAGCMHCWGDEHPASTDDCSFCVMRKKNEILIAKAEGRNP